MLTCRLSVKAITMQVSVPYTTLQPSELVEDVGSEEELIAGSCHRVKAGMQLVYRNNCKEAQYLSRRHCASLQLALSGYSTGRGFRSVN
jgi:hypothetical protein